MSGVSISKSNFVLGLQCDKSLYLKKNNPEFGDPISLQSQNIFDMGNRIGVFAQLLFPGGVDVKENSTFREDKIEKTQQYIEDGEQVLYEAGFSYNNMYCFVDILVKKGDGWLIHEVKSSTKITKNHIKDVSFQYYILEKCGLNIKGVYITHINNQYKRKQKLLINKLFKSVSVIDKVLANQELVETKVNHFFEVLIHDDAPQTKIGSHCTSPYVCMFKTLCWKDIPSYSVFDISRLSSNDKWDLFNQGIVALDDIPKDFSLLARQQTEVDSYLNDQIVIEKKSLTDFLNKVSPNIYFLDFETYQSAIPTLVGTNPYQQIPFQYSAHYLDEKQAITHFEFLSTNLEDPREEFILSLIEDLRHPGDIFVYNISFEKQRLQELSRAFPDYASLLNDIIDRMVDLIIPFKNGWYYSPKMKGKNSIKNVLPALVPGFSYQDLDINNGILASQSFLNLSRVEDQEQVNKTRKDLLEYCKLDTLAMVKIFEVLKQDCV